MADGETIVVTCSCGQRMKAPRAAIGKSAACVKCGEPILIQDDSAAPPSPGSAAQRAPESSDRGAPPTPASGSVMDTLKKEGLVTDEALREVELLRKDLDWTDWEALIESGWVSQNDFMKVMSSANVARIDLKNYNIPTDVVDFVPKELIKRGRLFPVDKLGKMLTIAMACPLDRAMIEEVASATGFKIKVMLAPLDELNRTINYYYPVVRGQAAYADAFSKELDKEFAEIAGENVVCARVYDADPPAPFESTVNALQGMGKAPLEEIRDTLAGDPVTSLMILSVANSAAYGMPKRVDNLALAAAVMGAPALVAASRVAPGVDYFSRNGAFDYEKFWKRSLICAKASELIAETQRSQRQLTAYTAGLVHGVGRLAMLEALPNSYAQLTAGLSGQELLETERRLFRVAHPEIGYIVVRKLNLPTGITESVRYHRDFENATKSTEVTASVGLAAAIADAYERGTKPSFDDETALLGKLSMTPAQAAEIAQQASAD